MNDDVPAAAATARRAPLSEMVRLGLYWLATSFHWGALLTIVIPAEVLRFVPEDRKGSALGLLVAGGAVMAMLLAPIAGALSDRSTLPMGRRRPFVIVGVLLNCLGLVGLRYAPTFAWYVGAVLLVQAANNFAGGAFNGLIPDRIPPDQRGATSGVMGFLQMLGTISGLGLAGYLVGGGHTAAVYWIIAGLLLGGGGVVVLGVPEEPLRQAAPFRLSQFVRSFWIDPRQYPDFAWVFVTRALVMLGFYTLITFLQFFLGDTLHVTIPKAAEVTARLGVITIASAALVALTAGWSSDRIGRKAIVSIAGGFLALTSVGLLAQPPYSTLVWIAVLFGIGYGAYTSVDWALALDVLPSRRSAAKDLGIWGIANTLPQVLAPLIGGPLLDMFNHRSPTLGYTVIFSNAIVYVVLGSLFVWKIKGAR